MAASTLKLDVLWSIILRKTLLLLLLLVPGCDQTSLIPEGVIDPAFIVFKDLFVLEAKSRNVALDVRGLSIVATSDVIQGQGHVPACGLTTTSLNGVPYIQIVENAQCWSAQAETTQEQLIFHELGHGLLKRQHDNALLPNTATLKSIMNGLGSLNLYTKYTPEKRKYYIDELFNENTPVPDWAKEKQFSKEVLNQALVSITEWRFYKLSDLDQAGTATDETTGSIFTIAAPARHEANESSYWKYSFAPVNISVGSKLTLTVSVKTSIVIGTGGASITLRGDSVDESVFFIVSPVVPDTGDFTVYTATLDYFPEQIQTISVLLTLDGKSSGSVSFKDVKLINYY
jgi:hypothetical protein